MTEGKIKTQLRVSCEFVLHAANSSVFEKNWVQVRGCFGSGGFFVVWHFFKWCTDFFSLLSLIIPSHFFPFPTLSKKSRNAMPLVFTNMYLPHVEHLCAGFGMQHVAILAQKIQNLWECPTVLAKNTTLFMNLECPLKASKCFTRKKIAHSTLFNTKTYISLQIQITQARGKYFSQWCLFSHVAQHVL